MVEYHCSTEECNFVAGSWYSRAEGGLHTDFCVHCFSRIYYKAVYKTESDYLEEIHLFRILKETKLYKSLLNNPSPLIPCDQSSTPKERRLLCESFGVKSLSKIPSPSFDDLFKPTGEYLFYTANHSLMEDTKQPSCTNCGKDQWWYDKDKEYSCPQCKTGILSYSWYPME